MKNFKKIFFLSSELTRKNEFTFLQPKIKKFFLLFFFSLFPFYFFLYSCGPTEPNDNKKISLSLEDVSCTEAWLKLETQNLNLPASVSLLQNNSVGQTFSLSKPDTIIYIDSLLPNKTYTFQVSSTRLPIGMIENPAASNEIQVQTLDTTSHNFTWQTFTFGEQGAGSSYLSDVAIVENEDGTDEIWAVGAIYLNDSTGQPDPEVYNAVHWNGNKWEVKKITASFRGNQITLPLEGIFAFSSSDIWCVGSLPIHGDGENWVIYDLRTTLDPNLSLSKVWGHSSNDVYFVGAKGSIAHYQNGQWSKIQSGTQLPINYIWGNKNQATNEIKIIAAASDKFFDRGKKLLEIKGSKVSAINDSGLTWSLSSIWFHDKYKVYIVGDGIFVKNIPFERWQNITGGITTFYTHSISGNNLNDIVLCGSAGELVHYNGSTWQSYRNNGLPVFYGNYLSVAIKGNIVCAVGEASLNSNKAIIALGFR